MRYLNLKTLYVTFFIVTMIVCIAGFKEYHYYKSEYKRAVITIKAMQAEQDSLPDKAKMYELKVRELKNANDYISKELLSTMKQLKVKPKSLISYSYLKTTITKVDTLHLRDTIFKNNTKIDTTLNNEWYRLKLSLHYPNALVVSPYFKSEKYIITFARKETIEPPKKFFLLRWFQKKHTVINVEVKERNPYIKSDSNRFVTIVK